LSIAPALKELAGATTDDGPWIYLSDGGHFENLGLYEMVRRRCRFIVVSDAGCDPQCSFEDLGNAVRKIYIDFGVSSLRRNTCGVSNVGMLLAGTAAQGWSEKANGPRGQCWSARKMDVDGSLQPSW
jgi:hypothetical protein